MTAVDQPPRSPELTPAKRALLERRLRRATASVIERRPADAATPLSFAQERLWFMEQFAPGTAAYVVPMVVHVGSAVDVPALRRALAELVARHESLRMRFPSTVDGRPTVVVDEPAGVDLPVVEVPDRDAADETVKTAAGQPFDLATGPLLRALLVRQADEDEHLLLLTVHHIVTDGWSTEILLDDLLALYRAATDGAPAPLSTPPVQYGDFAQWQRARLAGPAAARDLAYWRQELAGVPALELPTDLPRPAVQSFGGGSVRFRLDAGLVSELEELGRAHGCTLFMTLLAGFEVLLSRYSGQSDFAVGSPVAGRGRPELEGVVGMFVNMLPLRVRLGDDPTVGVLLERVRATVLDALAHQEVPFEMVLGELGVPRDVSRSPLFQAMFVLQNYDMPDRPAADGAAAALRWRPIELPATRFDLELHAYADSEGLACRLVYNTALFQEPTVARMAEHLTTLLTDLSTRPQARASELDLLSTAELDRVVVGWNATGGVVSGQTLVGLVAQQVGRSPDVVAVVDERRCLTFGQLWVAAGRVAGRLRGLGVGPESVVAVCAQRSVELVVGLLGVLRSGAAYLPLDPEYPPGRLELMLADSGAGVVLTQRELVGSLPALAGTVLLLDDEPQWATGFDVDDGLAPDSAAYVIYTSGSTGRPKGVVNTHRGVVNRLLWMQEMFGLDAGDVVLQKTPASFDVSVWEFFWPLVAGARLVLARPGGHRDPAYLRWVVEEHAVTTMHFVPSMLSVFLADLPAGACGSLRRVVCSGEELPAGLARRCVQVLPQAELHNLYGPTEAAVDVTAWWCDPSTLAGLGRVPIGRPVLNTRMYVLDRWLAPVPVGAVGQLFIGGVQVARGYHGRAGLTAQRFVPDPFGGPGGRLYATGDLVRWLPGGVLEFLGRMDTQVKVRGLRIELGEVEAALREMAGVVDAVVTVHEGGAGDQRLVAYVVDRSDPAQLDVAALRGALKARLPDYMVPAVFVTLDALPLTPNGKLDRAALPAPDFARAASAGYAAPSYAAPRTSTERAIAAIWAEVLGVERVGVDDDFFDLGGHSLLAVRVLARVATVTRVPVPVQVFFAGPTVAGLAAEVERRRAAPMDPEEAALPAVERRPAGTEPPLSFAQERLWFMEQFAPGTAAYSVPMVVHVGPAVDVPALRRALAELAARHESLRMRFPSTVDGQPTVVVDEPADVPLPVREAADAAAARRMVEAAAAEPFDLAAGPLLRALLVRDGGSGEHWLALTLHHIVTDGWSTEILLDDLMELYWAARSGKPAGLRPLPVAYGDYAYWQRNHMSSAPARRALAYWREELAGVPVLELPTDLPRPVTQSFEGESFRFRLDAELVGGLVLLGRARGCTLFMTLLAGFEVLLSRYSGQSDFAVGSPVAGRGRPELEGVVGMFVNMLPLRVRLGDDPAVGVLLERVRATVLDALANQEMPFEKVIQELNVVRDVSRSPLFQAMFVLQNYDMPDRPVIDGGGGTAAWTPIFLPTTRYDLELHAYADSEGLACRFIYNTALFTADTIARLTGHLRTLWADLAARPGARLSELSLMDAAELDRVVTGWNATGGPVPAQTLVGLVADQMGRSPGVVAVVDQRRCVTFEQLWVAAGRVAGRLRGLGVGPESVVAVCAQRSVELVVGLLGVLRAGAAYLPLDPEYPPGRLGFMLADSGAGVVLTQRDLVGSLPVVSGTVLLLDDEAQWVGVADDGGSPDLVADSAAYVIYTSGSTGRPKGVVNTHRGVVNRLLWMQEMFGLGVDDVVLQKTPASFDVSVWEFFWPLAVGARLVLARPGGHRDPSYLRSVIEEHAVTTVHFVPSMLSVFLADVPAGACGSLRRVVCSGEELPAGLARQCVQVLPQAQLHNLYGPTEAAVDVTAWWCDPRALERLGRVPIGGPVLNTRVYVLDRWLVPVPVGAVGQLFIGGVQVARGYLGRAGLTAARFVPDPFGGPGGRLYATGDLVRWLPGGVLEFLGRVDAQVKVRGLRIELGEVEGVLREQVGVVDAVVRVHQAGSGDQRLVAYVVTRDGDGSRDGPGASGRVGVLREALKARLPDYMVPAAFVALDALPLTPNGKLDRAALPAPDFAGAVGAGYAAPQTGTERAIAAIWTDVLGIDRVGIDDDFFDLGGHSLLATQVVARLRPLAAEAGTQVGVMDMFQHPTVRGLAALIDQAESARPRRLLYELTKPVPPERRVCSYVCVPYGGGSAVVYQPLADALPAGHRLYSVAIPGHDVGLDEESLPFDELARRCVEEILERVDGPLVLYGHCGVGGALIVELARRLEAAGRELEAVYVGGVFPFATPKGMMGRLLDWFNDRTTTRTTANWLKSMGVDMDELDPAQADRIIANMRHDGRSAAENFARMLEEGVSGIRAPIISVVGNQDPVTDFYQERYREWHFLTSTVAVIVLDEAGHFFLKHRAAELAEIVTGTHQALARGDEERLGTASRGPEAGWWLHEAHRAPAEAAAVPAAAVPGATDPVRPSMRRFFAVTAGQLVSLTGSALTQFAIPVWIFLETGSLGLFGLFGVVAFGPGLLVLPVAGAVADRFNRRRVMMISALVAGGAELVMAMLLWTGRLAVPHIYVLVVLLTVASSFQRMAYLAAIPQLVPKRYLGHANGVAQLVTGFAMLVMPMIAAGLLAAIGLAGILFIDVVSYTFALLVLACVAFPKLMGRRRRETFGAALMGGLRYSWGNSTFRAMLIYSAVVNLFLALPLLLIPPLVLGFGSLAQVGQVAFAEALGAVVGGLAMAIWGGPRRRLMIAYLAVILAVAGFSVLTGLRPALLVVAAGVFGTALALAVANGIYMTLLQVKVPQRFHGRVIALNQTIAWSTFPVGFGVLAPLAGALLEPPLAPGGALASTVGAVIGTGPGRGLALACILSGIVMAVVTAVAFRVRRIARADDVLPDSLPDDLVGVQAREERLRRLDHSRRDAAEPVPA